MSPPPKHGQTFPSAAALGAPPRAFCSASVMASASGSGSAGCGLLTLEMTSWAAERWWLHRDFTQQKWWWNTRNNGFTMVSAAKSGGSIWENDGFYQNVGVSNLWNWSGFYTGGEKCGSLVDLTAELTKRGVSVTIWLWLTWPWKITMFHR